MDKLNEAVVIVLLVALVGGQGFLISRVFIKEEVVEVVEDVGSKEVVAKLIGAINAQSARIKSLEAHAHSEPIKKKR